MKALGKIEQQIKDRDLLGFLGSRNVLPKYGFPSDVVELRTNHLESTPEAGKIELQRDLRMAISEFAPGSQVVAAKKIWTSGGLRIHPRRTWQTFKYAVCKECKKFHHGQDLPATCSCGTPIEKPKEFIIPESGFVASPVVDTPGEEPPQRTYASQVYFADYAQDKIAKFNESAEFILDDTLALPTEKRYSRYGWMALVNDGHGQGFRICTTCGWGEVISFSSDQTGFGIGGKAKAIKPHNHPISNKPCSGKLISRHLGHHYLTDVLELRFIGTNALLRNQAAMQSLMYALLEGASEAVGIRRDDIDGTLYQRSFGEPPSIILV